MKPIQIALVSTSRKVSFTRTARIAAALQKQLANDFAPIWKIDATINAFARIDKIPESHWRIIIMKGVVPDGGDGDHRLAEGNGEGPVAEAKVTASQPLDQIALTCSHELLEMLVNPDGKKLSKPSIPPFDPDLPAPLRPDTRVKFLMEICDPCEAYNQGYDIDGIRVCNFCTPEYYHDDQEKKRRFFQGGSGLAREVLGGGYVSFQTADKQRWRTQLFFGAVNTSKEPDNGAVAAARSAFPRETPYFQPPTAGAGGTRPAGAATPKRVPQV